MKKKIVIVGPAHPYRGGQALVEAYLHHMLSGMGYDCHTVSYTLLYPKIFFPGTTQYDVSGFVPFPHPERIQRLINSVNPLSWFRAAREVKKLNPDGVIFVWWMPFFGPALGTIARLLRGRTKRIFLVENYVSHENRWFDKAATRFALKHADAFISESKYITEQISARFPQKPLFQATLSVYDCYDLKRFTRDTAREHLGIRTGKVILFFGLIRPYKGLDKLIQAFAVLRQTHPDTTLLVVGECYEDVNKYINLINEAGIRDSTMMINQFIPNEDVEPYFKAADVVCMPYNSGTQSGILMMSYGFRIPVVVTEVGGISELMTDGKTGKVIPDNSTEHLVAGITSVLDNPGNVDYASEITSFTHGLGYDGLGNFMEHLLNN